MFPEAWGKLSDAIRPDRALLLTGSHSARDRDEEQATFVVEAAQPLDELKPSGAIGVALAWSRAAPPDAAEAVAALCAAHPGPAPVLVEWAEGDQQTGGRGTPDAAGARRAAAEGGPRPPAHARLRSRSLRVEADDELLAALRGLLGPDHVHLVRATPPPVQAEPRPRSNDPGTASWKGAT